MENTISASDWKDGMEPIPLTMINIEGIFNLKWELKKIIQSEKDLDIIITTIDSLFRSMVEEGVKVISRDDYDIEDLYMPQYTINGFKDSVKVDILCCLGICSTIDIKPKNPEMFNNN